MHLRFFFAVFLAIASSVGCRQKRSGNRELVEEDSIKRLLTLSVEQFYQQEKAWPRQTNDDKDIACMTDGAFLKEIKPHLLEHPMIELSLTRGGGSQFVDKDGKPYVVLIDIDEDMKVEWRGKPFTIEGRVAVVND